MGSQDAVEGMRRARFEALFDLNAPLVARYLARRVRAAEVEDLTAEVFLTAWRKLDEIPAGFELPWLYRTCWNHLANHYRKPKPLLFDQAPESTEDTGDVVAEEVVELGALTQGWRQLSPRDREILRLAVWEGLGGSELALALGISVSAAEAALSRARARFRQALGE